MNMTKPSCPPLTPDDILTLRGKPLGKWVGPTKDSNLRIERRTQKWIYVSLHTNIEEHYFFKNGYLTGWQKTAL